MRRLKVGARKPRPAAGFTKIHHSPNSFGLCKKRCRLLSRAVPYFDKLQSIGYWLPAEHEEQVMNIKMLRAFVLVLTAFVAVSLFVCFDDLREYEAVHVQGEMLKESADPLAGHRHQQLSYGAPASSARKNYSPGSPAAKPFALVSLSTCVLLC